MSDIVLLFGPDDCILLGEGWGDVIIVFLGDPDEERLDSIFRIQNAIYQDFLVERTELILTSISMDEARKKWNEYEVTSFFRIRGDSEQRVNEKFLLGIKSVGRNLGIQDELYVRRIPGLTDFAVDWTRVAAEKFGSSKFSAENIALELEKAGVAAEIDDIVTIISRKERV